jgi:hypothetical protein
MSDSTSQLPPRPSLEQLRKQAKDRVKTLRAQGIDATLADVQFALAREYGFKDWADLAHYVETINSPGLRQFEQMAAEIAAAYSSGDVHAIREFNWIYGTSFVWHREPERMYRELAHPREARALTLPVGRPGRRLAAPATLSRVRAPSCRPRRRA